MSILSFYDSVLADIPQFIAQQGDEQRNRAALLRQRLNQRLVDELALNIHSVAPSVLVPYLGTAIRCYLIGFYDVAIRDLNARVRAALQGRLLAIMLWEDTGRGQQLIQLLTAKLASVGGQNQTTLAQWKEKFRATNQDPFDQIDSAFIVNWSKELGLFAGPWEERVYTSLRQLNTKDVEIVQRDRNQGRQLAIHAIENGLLSGGPGAVQTESVLGFYLTWGAELPNILADAAMAMCLVLMAGNRQMVNSQGK
jgi:hypothetical protein